MDTLAPIQMYVGDLVRRRRPWDGSMGEGQPFGPLLTVTQIFPQDPVAVCMLSDGEYEAENDLERFAVDVMV